MMCTSQGLLLKAHGDALYVLNHAYVLRYDGGTIDDVRRSDRGRGVREASLE